MQKSVLLKTVGLTLGALVVSACANKGEIEQPVVAPAPVAIPVESVTLSAEELQAQAQAELRNTTVFYFDFDAASIKSKSKAALAAHAAYLAANPTVSVVLEGHADERGTVEYNLALGERRGVSVRRFLLANGAAASQLNVVSLGEEKPANISSNEASWAENRRVEVKY